jgi:hypothetical protein
MAKKAEADPKEVLKAFRRAASELGCNQSEQRFQEALFAIGRHKALRGTSKVIPEEIRVPSSPVLRTRGKQLLAAALAQKQQSRGPNWKSIAALPGPTDSE